MKNYERTKIGAFFYRMTMACGRFLFRHPILAQILNLTWGILGTLAGVIEMLVVLLLPKKKSFGRFNGFPYVMFGSNWGGLEGVLWFFVADDMGDEWTFHTKEHETGHSFQNAIYGPFAIFLIFIPSFIRYWIRMATHSSSEYDSVWFEGSATDLGTEYYLYRLQKESE